MKVAMEIEQYLERLSNTAHEAATQYHAGDLVQALDQLDIVQSLARVNVRLIQRELESS